MKSCNVTKILILFTSITAGVYAFSANEPYDARIDGKAILTPSAPASPRINGPVLYGARSDKPFVYRIPTTGERPIRFSAEGLPKGLELDQDRGIISGRTPLKEGEYPVVLTAENPQGSDTFTWKLVVGDTLALTPPMGWNHWYTHYHFISDAKIRFAADAMVTSGMADVGYQYVSIDDCWMRITLENAKRSASPTRGQRYSAGLNIDLKVGPTRNPDGTITTAYDFPDMKALTNYIHSHGLKAGIYTSPGPRTCQEFEGSYQHEEIDARTFANWGFDLLKHDLCRYREILGTRGNEEASLEAEKEPYLLMGDLLRKQDRDIVLNLCQYGRADVWKWAKQAGHSWRTGGDLGHTLLEGGVYKIAEKTIGIRKYNGPGGWNDPDYLILGMWRRTEAKAGPLTPVALSPNEHYSYFSLWCMMACPLFFSGDMDQLDQFTTNILCNTEMIAVNQDPLGQCAEPVRMEEDQWVLKKPMADGSMVVGLFNLSETEDKTITVTWDELDQCCPAIVRDLWRQSTIGLRTESFSATMGPRGCVIVKLMEK